MKNIRTNQEVTSVQKLKLSNMWANFSAPKNELTITVVM